jgi:hypothetical protein
VRKFEYYPIKSYITTHIKILIRHIFEMGLRSKDKSKKKSWMTGLKKSQVSVENNDGKLPISF